MKILEEMKKINWVLALKNPYSYIALIMILITSSNIGNVTTWETLVNEVFIALNNVQQVFFMAGSWITYLAAYGYPTENKTKIEGE